MASAYIYKEDVPVYIDGMDFGLECTLVRDGGMDYSFTPEWYGTIAFTKEQAMLLSDLVNSHNDAEDPYDDYLQGRIEYDGANDAFIEYSDNDGTQVYDVQAGFDVDGETLYCIGPDWCWSL